MNIFNKTFASDWIFAKTWVGLQIIGPSGVRALPVAAGTNKGGHYFRYF